MKILSTLPLFQGFYGTHFEADEDPMIEDGRTYDDYDWDYEQYRNDVGEYLTETINEKIKELFPTWELNMEFKHIDSPRFYNFTNDKIEVEYTLNKETKILIYKELLNNNEEFKDYISEHFTSRSGFVSFYSNDVNDWLIEVDERHSINDYVVLGQILNFLLSVEWCNENDFYLEVCDGMPYVSGELITE